MKKVTNFLRGNVGYTIEGEFPERFLNLCAQENLSFWDICWEGRHVLKLRCARQHAKKVEQFAQKVNCSCKRNKEKGVPVFLRQFRRRYALLVGLVLSITTACILSQFVLVIEVVGNERVSTAEIRSQLQRQGVTVGAYGPNLELRQISQQALLGLPDLAWMSVNLHGTRAEVLVRENLEKPEIRDETTPAHVVAGTTGIITEMEVHEGQREFEVGQAVLEGEIIISGIIDLKEPEYGEIDAGQKAVHARGNVYAHTWRTLVAEIPLTAQVKRYTGETKSQWAATILSNRVNFFGNSGISMPMCDKITVSYNANLYGVGSLPFSVHVDQYQEYTLIPCELQTDVAQQMLEESLQQQLVQLLEDGEIIATEYTSRQVDGKLQVTLIAECKEQIGREVLLEGETGIVSLPTPKESGS